MLMTAKNQDKATATSHRSLSSMNPEDVIWTCMGTGIRASYNLSEICPPDLKSRGESMDSLPDRGELGNLS